MAPTAHESAKVPDQAEWLRLLIESLTEYAIYTIDPNGFVTGWNAGAQRLQGYRSDEIVGQHYARLFTRADQARGVPVAILAQAKHKGQHESEGWRVRKDGSKFLGATLIQTIRDPSGAVVGFGSLTRDMSEREAAQQALLESEQRFRLLVEGVVDYAIYMLDPSGIITNWNAGAQRIKGYHASEIVGHHFSRFYTKDDRAAGLPAHALHTAAQEGRYEAEGWSQRKDGSRFWAAVVVNAIRDEAGNLVGFTKLTRDITERRQAHEALRESERQFRLLVGAVTDYALYMLDPNGIVTSWNAGAQRVKGYSADEIIGQHFSRCYTESERLAGIPARSLQTAEQQGRYQAEGWRVRRDGTLFWANVVITAIRDENKELIGFAKITRDVTERREAQKALQHTQAQLAQSQKLDALGQLTGGIAHDFNNMLMIIGGHIQTLKKLAAGNARAERAADAIELAARRGELLTRQLLTFARRQTLNPVVINLPDAIEGIRTMLASLIGGFVELVAKIDSTVWPIEVDVNELELAIVNLALNARDAMAERGAITISAENVRLRRGEAAPDLEGEFVALTITDTGCGIPEDILPKVFDPFFSTKQAGKGTGLGLSQVHGFAHQSGGTVVVRSEIGKGTRVSLYLPRADAASSRGVREHGKIEQGRGGRVLLVEDNPEVADLSRDLLEQLGYEVTAVLDAQAALQALDQQKFDLVLSDIVMAGTMNGLGLARVIRAQHPDLSIVLATGYNDAAQQVAGEFAVLRKPYQLADLSRVLPGAMQHQRDQSSPSNLVSFWDAKRDRARSE